MAIIDLPKLTKQEMMDINEVIFTDRILQGYIKDRVTIHTGIESGDRIAFLGKLSKIGKASRGCAPAVDDATAPLIERFWALKEWDAKLKTCYQDLEGILYRFGLHDGVNRPNLEDTQYAELVRQLMGEAIEDLYNRIAWFGDTEAEHEADGGNFNANTDLTFYNFVDGFFKQIELAIANNEGVIVTAIDANTQGTRAGQLSYWDAEPTQPTALNILDNVILNAPVELTEQTDQIIYATKFFINRLITEMLALPQYTENQIVKNEEGITLIRRQGHDVIQLNEWDTTITTDQNLANAYCKPFRVLYTSKANLAMGVPSIDTFKMLNSWYNEDTRNWFIEAMDKVDFKLLRPELVSIAW